MTDWHRAVERCEILPEALQKPRSLFRLALIHDPNDSAARRHLIRSELEGIEYSVHELPYGVLYSGGASVEECGIMLDDLQQLGALLQLEGLTERYRTVVEYARFHYQAYRDYLLNHPGRGFAWLLETGTWGTPPERPQPGCWS